jgi:hypothetical protein
MKMPSLPDLRPFLLGTALAAVMVVAFLLRIAVFDVAGTDYFHVDVARDYLIASHILAYHDLPLVGPDNFLGATFNSPLYYYIVAGLLFVQNNFLFPGLLNVLLQTLAVLLVFLGAHRMFGSLTALIAAFLFAVSDGVVTESMQMWQPYLMQFVLLCSYLALLSAYRTKRPAYLIAGLMLCAAAALIHNAVWAVAPLYLAACIGVLRAQHASLRIYILSAAFPLLLLACAYAPNLYLAVGGGGVSLSGDLHFAPLSVILQSLSAISNLYTYLLEGSLRGATLYGVICIVISAAGGILYLFAQKDAPRRRYFGYLLSLLISEVIAVGLLTLNGGGFPIRYFIPVYAVFFVLLAELLSWTVRTRGVLMLPIVGIAVVSMGWVSSEYVRSRLTDLPERVHESGVQSVYPRYSYPSDIDVLADYIDGSLRTSSGELQPFDVRTFQRGAEDGYANELIWVPLEWRFGVPFVRTDTHTLRGYATRREPEVLFIRCVGMEEEVCQSLFEQKYGAAFHRSGMLRASENVLYISAQKNF